ncbi:MAG: hypothetical protein KDA81_08745 [Planctomycetaceae bacterium]|nr:hypothetical protein [Planctomycetaceae bacterium]
MLRFRCPLLIAFSIGLISSHSQSNLGRVELKQIGDFVKAELFAYRNFRASLSGRLVGNTVTDNWTDQKANGSFRLVSRPSGAPHMFIFDGRLNSNTGRGMDITVLPVN